MTSWGSHIVVGLHYSARLKVFAVTSNAFTPQAYGMGPRIRQATSAPLWDAKAMVARPWKRNA